MRLGLWGRSFSFPRASALALWLCFGFDRQPVERAAYAAHGLWRDGCVAGGRFDAGMAEHDLNGASVGAAFQQVGGKAVAQHMRSDAFGDACQLAGIAAKILDGRRLEMRAGLGAGKKPFDRALHFIVSTQQDEGAMAEHGVAILGSFTVLDVNQHAFGVDVFGFEGNGFGDAQASGARVESALSVAEHQHGAVLQDADMAEEGQHLFFAEYNRQFLGDFHTSELLLGPRHVKRYRVQKLRCGQETVDRIRGELTLIDQVELIVPDIIQPQPLRAQIVVSCIAGNIMDITTLGSGGKISQLHVFQHALF